MEFIRRDTSPRVLDLKADMGTLPRPSERQHSALWHGIHGVFDKLNQHVVKGIQMQAYRPQSREVYQAKCDTTVGKLLAHLQSKSLDHRPEFHWLRVQLYETRE